MKKLPRLCAPLGMTLGLLPAIVVTDLRYAGLINAFVFLVVFGLPGMLIGAVSGEVLQYGFNGAQYIAVPVGVLVGVLVGGIAGMAALFFVWVAGGDEWLGYSEGAMVIAVFIGGLCGMLLGGRLGRGIGE